MSLPSEFRPARVLLIRPRGLGDVVLSTVVLDALGRAWPGVPIDYLSQRPSRNLLEAEHRLDRVFLLGPTHRAGRVSEGRLRHALRWIREGRPDLVLDLFSNPYTALITALSGARFRVGLDKRARRLAYNVRVPRFRGRPEEDRRYAQEVQLDFLRAAGIRWDGEPRATLAIPAEDREAAARALESLGYAPGDRFGTVLPGGSWESKRWSVAGFVEVARALRDATGQPALVAWGPPERGDAEAIAREGGAAARQAPATTMRVMAAMLGRSAVLVAPDCLARHLAIVQGVPTVGIFSTTDPRHWTPREGPHRTVRAVPGEGVPTLRDLPPAPVIAAVRELLAEVDAAGGQA